MTSSVTSFAYTPAGRRPLTVTRIVSGTRSHSSPAAQTAAISVAATPYAKAPSDAARPPTRASTFSDIVREGTGTTNLAAKSEVQRGISSLRRGSEGRRGKRRKEARTLTTGKTREERGSEGRKHGRPSARPSF